MDGSMLAGFGLVMLVVAVLAAWFGARSGARRRSDEDVTLQQAVDTLVAVAGEQLQAQHRAGAVDLDHRKELIDTQLGRMGDTLGEVGSLLRRLETERSVQFGQVREQLAGVARQHGELTRTTGALREALTSSQARGQWGERMAADVLRAAGFVEGVNYRTQVTTRSGTRPDVTFLLPGDQVLHMDVKFPLGRYLEMLEAESDADREAARTGFLRAVRQRVKELDGRGYIDPEDGTLDCVLLFIPNEQVYGFVHEQDPSLLDDALARRVVLCSPNTLFAVLAVVRQAVESAALERTGDEILQLLSSFTDQWSRFTDQLDKLGRGLETTQKAYDSLTTTRRTQLERQLARIEELRCQRGGEPTDPDAVGGRLVAFPDHELATSRTSGTSGTSRAARAADGDPGEG